MLVFMPGEVNDSYLPSFDKDGVKKLIKKIENQNGSTLKEFSVKEIIIMMHGETQNKLNEHIKWGEKEDRRLSKALNDHDLLFQKIMNVLPQKGFCEKVTNILWPEHPDLPLDQKVNIIWHDRRLLKYIFAAIILLGGGDILLRFLG